jgi:hypothetical protein
MLVLGAVLIAAAIFLYSTAETTSDMTGLAVTGSLGILFLFAFGFYPDWKATQDFARDSRLKTETSAEFSEKGIHLDNAMGHSDSLWSTYSGYAESASVVLIYAASTLFLVFPKRAFAPGDLAPFQALLARKLQRRK